ncbi:DUF3017 domain-containing protein [Cellulomonas edaphi]|uniref:DUF3017 domain-containing protein n=1 Tax=Cellulomonas edaphi TaxID=3053468 RepID=A0ABT7S8I9_9CELL|nr:DUF3017 domain-containing protein [Cellulomons edaphi]MDM7831926.1 DUF3017 domain-containing protein [Cellulomons edaphi]
MAVKRVDGPAASGAPDGAPDEAGQVDESGQVDETGRAGETGQVDEKGQIDETAQVDPVPVPPSPEEQVLDPRAIARASLEASRNASLWWTSAGVLVAAVVAVVVGTRAGAYTLAGVLAACAVVRAVLPHPGPIAISVRAKAIDIAVLATLAVGIGVLAQLLPGRTV